MRLAVDPDAPLCSSGKHPYRDKEAARKGLRTARHLRGVSHVGYRPDCVEEGFYECGACKWFHLTSSTKPRRRKQLGNRGRRRR
jgi:hypothetical protein